jgi:cysteine sulfinate desulfinase/cysteine desulfurase-like protein
VGLGTAARFAREERAEEQEQIRSLRDLLQQELVAKLDATVNGHPEQRLANILNLNFTGLDADSLMERTPGVALSASAACTSASMQPSYVLAALGYDEVSKRSEKFTGVRHAMPVAPVLTGSRRTHFTSALRPQARRGHLPESAWLFLP